MTDSNLSAGRDWARSWLLDAALPLWWEAAADRTWGGWAERLDQQGKPTDDPRRARVQARMVFVYAQAKRLGWRGPADDAIRHGLDYLLSRYRRSDGLFRKAVLPDGTPADDGYDLYDQAFALLALNAAYRALGQPAEIRAEADALLGRLDTLLAHPFAGFEEARPRALPLRSNPHMHMLEALLAWTERGVGGAYEARARQIAELARTRFIDPATGAIGEYFDGDWHFMPGDKGGVREPGHQFEWAYLLGEADRLLGTSSSTHIQRLYAFGAQHGVDPARGVAVFEMDAEGRIIDPDARLWSQTERLRTALTLGHDKDADEALAAIRRFLDVPVRGLWLDRMKPDGHIVDEPAPGSSFYHIVSALLPLIG
ncbi:AGE family epimerase/isomerase [Sphingomonas jatrophae]|uniref:Mannose-6-phosphate isomerase, type 3 n=1 Tax=Sphingomonas jatrophae TaxID=1166337 RepID=A0A1I6JVL3_9SPHN|nr:AGE family epimerase/isomerase [Sphingomonas jatrophae]SFR82993.1 mannose-6-phosphate isomerase, type 3 [Sphingomonas jatrophae]